MSLAMMERCERCNVPYQDHDIQNDCFGFLSSSDVRRAENEKKNWVNFKKNWENETDNKIGESNQAASRSYVRSGEDRRFNLETPKYYYEQPEGMQTNRRINFDRRANLSTDERDMLNLYKPEPETDPQMKMPVTACQTRCIVYDYMDQHKVASDIENHHINLVFDALYEHWERNK